MKIWRCEKFNNPARAYRLIRYFGLPCILLIALILIGLATMSLITMGTDMVWISLIMVILITLIIIILSNKLAQISDVLTKVYILNENDDLYQVDLTVRNAYSNAIIAYYMNSSATANAIEFINSHVVGNTLNLPIGTLGSVVKVEELLSTKNYKGGMYFVCINRYVDNKPKTVTLLIDNTFLKQIGLREAFEHKRLSNPSIILVNHNNKIIASIIGAVICIAVTCLLYPHARNSHPIQAIYFLFLFLDMVAFYFVLLFLVKSKRGEP